MLRAHTRSRGLGAAAGGPSLWDYSLTAGTLPPVLSVARASTATRVNAAGLIVVEAANTARFDFDPISHACRGLLLEQQRTNYSAQSENASAWSGANISVSSDIGIAPDGAGTADKLGPINTGAHYFGPAAFSMTAATAYTFSVIAKAAELSFLQIIGLSNVPTAANFFINFNLAAGIVGNVGAGVTNYEIMPLGSGWFVCSVSGVAASSAGGRFGVVPLLSDSAARAPSYSGDGASGILVWGAQTETTDRSSYIPTGATAATRDADVLTLLDTSRAVEVTYTPLAGGAAQTVTIPAGQQPGAIYGRLTRVRQI